MTNKDEQWVRSIEKTPWEEAKSSLNEIIFSVCHTFSQYERKILIKALRAIEKQIESENPDEEQ